MTGQDGLRDEIVAALVGQNVWYIAVDTMAVDLADAVLPVVQRHIADAREQDHAAIETQISEHVVMQIRLTREQVAEQIAQAIEARAKDGTWNFGGQVVLEIAAHIARRHVKGDGDGQP